VADAVIRYPAELRILVPKTQSTSHLLARRNGFPSPRCRHLHRRIALESIQRPSFALAKTTQIAVTCSDEKRPQPREGVSVRAYEVPANRPDRTALRLQFGVPGPVRLRRAPQRCASVETTYKAIRVLALKALQSLGIPLPPLLPTFPIAFSPTGSLSGAITFCAAGFQNEKRARRLK
jgi:hypothetical protein